MKAALLAVALACLLVLSRTALADEVKIIWSDPSCSYFIAQLGEEFGIYNWRSGPDPDEGDVMSGPVTEEGTLTLTNATKGGSNTVILVGISPRLKSLINQSPVYCKKRYKSS
jgi:hypothetical protein